MDSDTGNIWAFGGYRHETQRAMSSVEWYDPSKRQWKTLTQTMTKPRYDHAAVYLPQFKCFLIGGGHTGDDLVGDLELFSPKTMTFTPLPSRYNLGYVQRGHRLQLIDNHLLVMWTNNIGTYVHVMPIQMSLLLIHSIYLSII
jgi:hypothetical protein